MSEDNKLTINVSSAIPTHFVDNLAVTTRSEKLYLLRFLIALPEGLTEQIRAIIPRENITRMIDVLCKHCDHYPEKVQKAKESKEHT